MGNKKKNNKKNSKKKNNNKRIVYIVIIIILVILISLYLIFNTLLYSKIKKGAIRWYEDHNEIYDKISIGALKVNGYIDNNKSLILRKNLDCKIIKIKDKKAAITRKYDCEYDKKAKDVPTIFVNFLDDNGKVVNASSWMRNYKLSISFKNDIYKESDIKTIKFYGNEDVILENNVIKNNVLDDKYIMELCMNDGKCFDKDIYLMVDNTPPIYQNFEVDGNYFEAKYIDEESGVGEVYYYINEDNIAPTDTALFTKRNNLRFEKDKSYYVWAIASNYAGVSSEINYVGTYKFEYDDAQSGSSKGSGGSATKSKE